MNNKVNFIFAVCFLFSTSLFSENIHAKGLKLLKVDKAEAFKVFITGAENGNSACMYELAVMYQDGIEVHKDAKQAVNWYEKSAKLGYAKAQNNLGLYYLNGLGGLQEDSETGYKFLKLAADQGLPESLFVIAYSYEVGMHYEKNLNNAKNFYIKAMDAGHLISKFHYGKLIFEHSAELKSDKEVGLKILKESANDDKVGFATLYLFKIYSRGIGVKKDKIEALKWISMAVELKLKEADQLKKNLETEIRIEQAIKQTKVN